MGNAVSGCCQTEGDSSDGPPPPWLAQSSADELGAAIDKKFPARRDGKAAESSRADVGCQAGFVESFHHGGGTMLLHFEDVAGGEAPEEQLDVGGGSDSEGDFAEVLRGCVDRCYVICHEVFDPVYSSMWRPAIDDLFVACRFAKRLLAADAPGAKNRFSTTVSCNPERGVGWLEECRRK